MYVELLSFREVHSAYKIKNARKRSRIVFRQNMWISSFLTKIIPISLFREKNVYDQLIWFV